MPASDIGIIAIMNRCARLVVLVGLCEKIIESFRLNRVYAGRVVTLPFSSAEYGKAK